jgi:RNA polymerase sigma factor (sigma-70 family)
LVVTISFSMHGPEAMGQGMQNKRKMQLQHTAPLSVERRRQFEDFYESHYAPALGYLSRILHSSDDAYDVLVHSFELALARFDEYLSSQEPRYWFFGIIRNSASYFLRKRAKEYKETLPIPRATPTPEDLLLASEDTQLIDRVLMALPEKYREVALLRFQDFSYKEIAAALGLSVEAVESRMRRAIIKLEPLYAQFKRGEL